MISHKTFRMAALGVALALAGGAQAQEDFGLFVQKELANRSEKLFGIERPLAASAYGPYTGADNTKAATVAKGLKLSVVSNVSDPMSDQMVLWPNDTNPTHLFVCVESFFSGNNPNQASLQRINLNGNPNNNVEVIVKGISSCDPVRRTPWGSIIVGEEAGSTGGFYEIMDPMSISAASPAVISDRVTGASSDARVVKRKAVGNLSFEGVAILEDGTMYFGDEKRPSNGKAGGGIFKFVPANPYSGSGVITDANASPFAAGTNYGLRVGSSGSDYGQASEIGKGNWVAIDSAAYSDAYGNISLGAAQDALKITGYYRPEDMDRDMIAAANGVTRVCWTNTGRMTNGLNSDIENGHNYGEIMCLVDGSKPLVTRLVAGDRDMNHFDNIAFQPGTGNIVTQEDGEVEVLNADGTPKELRGNDIWMCLPDGADRDVMTDGCVRIVSIKDTDAESTGFLFDASGETAYFNIQHRATGKGALMKLTGFRVNHH